MCGIRLSPVSVSSYSTRGGTSAYTFRLMKAVFFQSPKGNSQHALGNIGYAFMGCR